jgi:hypothetical protein
MFPPERSGTRFAESGGAIQMSKSPRPAFGCCERIAEGIMVWHDRGPDLTTDPASAAVLEAFDAAQTAHLPPVTCYRAGVEAWRRAHPDQMPKCAALQAVAVILAAKVSLRVDDA